MKGYIQLIRPVNCIMGAVAVFVAAFITSGNTLTESEYFAVYFAMAVVILFMAAGNALNDYFDKDIDKINHPERPIPSGRIAPKNALIMAYALFGASIALSIFINILAFLLVIINVSIIVAYETMLKSRGLSGNAIVSWLTATLFLFGGLAVFESTPELLKVSTLVILAFTASLGREITKDIQDVKGDIDRRTLPKRIGIRGACYVGSAMFLLTALLSLTPLWLDLFEYLYIPLIILTDVIFIYCSFLLFENPKLTSNLVKVGMVIALAAFIAGGMNP